MNDTLKSEVVQAICTEIERQKLYLAGANVESIYFGGGTPSLLTTDELSKIMSTTHKHFKVNSNAEITLEANPDDLSKEKIEGWKSQGVNRLSIGIQSFREKDLKWMNRAHNAQEALNAVGLAKDNGIDNLSLDLIYGIPGLSVNEWQKNIEIALELEPTHLSCYALTVEEDTPLYKLIKTKRSAAPKDENTIEHFDVLMESLAKEGWEHYEISNFCKTGHRAVHNSNYWKGKSYLGIGPSAHSYNGVSRQWNVAHNVKYIEAIGKGIIPMELEVLSKKDKINEEVLISLRTKEGLSLANIQGMDVLAAAQIKTAADEHVRFGNLKLKNGVYALTKQGKHLADGIASDLFLD